MQRAALTALALLSLGLAACTTATPYQPLASGNTVSGGFSEQKLDDTHVRVTFKGNEMTSRAQVETYLLYRAAEVTTAQGADWFEMADKHTHDTSLTYLDPAYGPGWSYWRPDWTFFDRPHYRGWPDPLRGGYDIDQSDEYQASAVIALGHGAKPADDPRAFDARQVLQNLGPTIVRPH